MFDGGICHYRHVSTLWCLILTQTLRYRISKYILPSWSKWKIKLSLIWPDRFWVPAIQKGKKAVWPCETTPAVDDISIFYQYHLSITLLKGSFSKFDIDYFDTIYHMIHSAKFYLNRWHFAMMLAFSFPLQTYNIAINSLQLYIQIIL